MWIETYGMGRKKTWRDNTKTVLLKKANILHRINSFWYFPTYNTLLVSKGTRQPSPLGGERRNLPLDPRSTLSRSKNNVIICQIECTNNMEGFPRLLDHFHLLWPSTREAIASHTMIFTLSGYFCSRWSMMLVVSLNQMPSLLSRTNGTWGRAAMTN